MSDLTQEEIDHLNHLAVGALLGFSQSGQADLVALLRSEAPLDWTVRNLMADAIEGSNFTGVSLVLGGHQSASNRVQGLLERRTWLEEGRAIAPIVKAAAGVTQGFLDAEEFTGKSDDHCRKRYYYAKNCDDWTQIAKLSGGFYSQVPDQLIEDVWHLASFDQKRNKPTPMSAAEYDATITDQVHFLRGQVPPSSSPESANLFVETMMHFMRLLPPVRG